ncbi:MAG: dTDP-4-dehydrorhamnose reductase [Microthrixaceae bacterium]
MRVLVTGACGQLGTELMGLLEGTPHEATGVDLPEVDLTDRDRTLGLVTSLAPDTIIHAAALTAVDACETEVELAHAVNCAATRFVAQGARTVGAHLVYLSTDYVFDGTKSSPYNEWDQPAPRSVYGVTKLGGEREVDPGWTIARTSWVCGAQGSNIVKTLLRLAGERETVEFVDDQRGHPTFARDLAGMVLKLAIERVPGTFHTTNLGAVSWYEFAREVFAAAGHDPDRVRPIATRDMDPPRPAPRPANSVLDNMAWRLSGFAPSRHHIEPLQELVRELTGA